MQFLRGIVKSCIGECSIHTFANRYHNDDGYVYEAQFIQIPRDELKLKKVTERFKTLGVTFDVEEGIHGSGGVQDYRLWNFRLE